MVLYILNRQEELLTVLHNDSELDGILDLSLVEDLAELSTLDFDVSGNTDGIEYLSEENYILTQNMAGKWKLFVTRKVTDIHGASVTKRVYAEDILSELGEYTVGTNYAGQTVNVKTVLTSLLKGTGFVVGAVDTTIPTVKIDQDTRYISKLALVQMLAELADLHIFTNVTVNGSDIADVSVSLTKTNKSEGKRFEFDGELSSIQRDVDTSAIKTAILPLGSAIEQSQEDIDAGKPVEYVTIREVEWYKAEGKPFDKPRGQELLIDPEATAKYGIKDETGEMQPRVTVMQFSDIDDPALLAEKAFLELDKLVNPQVNYTFSASDMSTQLAQMGLEEQPVEVGDVCYVLDNSVNPPIIQEVVIRRIAGNPDNRTNMEVEIGTPLSSFVDDNGTNSFTGTSPNSGGSGGDCGGIKDGDTVNALTIINGTVTNLRVINGSIQSLTATSGEFEDLTANTARVQSLFVNNANFDTIMAGKADIGTLNAVDADLQQLKSNVAYIDDLTATNAKVETLEAEYAEIDELLAGNITADNIKAGSITSASGVIGDLSANNITTGTLDAGRIKVTNLSADVIKTGTLDASLVRVTNIDATHIGTGTLDAGKITVKNLSASSITTGTLDASRITVTNLSASNIVTGTLDASKIKVTNINANNITAGTIDASRVNVTNINASNITTGTIDATKITISNMNAGSITGGTIDAVKVKIINLNASNITSGVIDANRITVSNINASNITGGTLDASRVNVTNLRADNIVAGSITVQGENLIPNSTFKKANNDWSLGSGYTVSTEGYGGALAVKYEKVGMTANQNIYAISHRTSVTDDRYPAREGDAFVSSVYFKIPANHGISGWTPSIGVWFYSKKDDGSLATAQSFIKGADLSLTDEWQRVVVSGVAPANTVAVKFVVRAQNNGTFYFAQPMLSRGTIASVWKPHTDELISDGAIDNNKIADNTIQSGKLFLDEILASRAFIEKFRAVEIDANQIRVNKITSDQLDVEGIVSFTKNPSIFGRDMEWIFDTSADQTWINGGAIWANSVTADKINAKGLKVETADKVTAFQVFDKASADASEGEYLEGDVLITGTLKSSNFDPTSNMGYKISKNGDVTINNALIRGDVILPNAGITNFGGTIGNDNILKNTDYSIATIDTIFASNSWAKSSALTAKVSTYAHQNGHDIDAHIAGMKVLALSYTASETLSQCYLNPKGSNLLGQATTDFIELVPNTDYTFSAWIYQGGSAGNCTFRVWGYDDEGGNRTSLKNTTLTSKWTGDFRFVTFTFRTDSRKYYQPRIYLNSPSGATSGTVAFNFYNMKLEVGDKATPYCPNSQDGGNYVRFWAGASYENRDEAPFQVLQDGTVKATVGEFGGTFTGKLEIGNIHIADTNTSTASIKINTNNNAQTLIELTEDTSFINTDFVLGSTSSPKFTYTKGNGSFKFSNSPVSIEGTKSFVYMPADNSPTVAIVGYNGGSYGDYSHEVKYNGGGLRFDQTGVAGSGIADFQFTKNDGSTDVNVSVQGNVQITNTIQMGGIQIINRTVGSEKRIDFVVL